MIIYKATNKINNKSYIGQTTQKFESYLRNHITNAIHNIDIRKGQPKKFYRAIRKYGSDNFEWSIIYQADSISDLNKKEMYYIEKYDSFHNGYNNSIGGEGFHIGFKRSKESIDKQRKKMLGSNHPLFGIGHKKESIEKMKKAKQGVNNPNSKRYKITSPQGEIFIVEGSFNKFCLEHHLWHNAMTNVARKEKDNHKGWKCEYLI